MRDKLSLSLNITVLENKVFICPGEKQERGHAKEGHCVNKCVE